MNQLISPPEPINWDSIIVVSLIFNSNLQLVWISIKSICKNNWL